MGLDIALHPDVRDGVVLTLGLDHDGAIPADDAAAEVQGGIADGPDSNHGARRRLAVQCRGLNRRFRCHVRRRCRATGRCA